MKSFSVRRASTAREKITGSPSGLQADYSRTLSFKVLAKNPGRRLVDSQNSFLQSSLANEASPVTPPSERIFHVNYAIVRAYAPVLVARIASSPSEDIVFEGCLSTFALAVDWMYGAELRLTPDDIVKWADDGCELLAVAQALGIEALEDALRRTIYEAPIHGGPQLAWAMLHVCARHSLHPELEQNCRVIARSGGFCSKQATPYLQKLSVSTLSTLMASQAWIVDNEEEILFVLESWIVAQGFKGLRDTGLDLLNLAQQSGRWDVRWSAIKRNRLELLAQRSVVPYCLIEDCSRWLSLSQSVFETPAPQALQQHAQGSVSGRRSSTAKAAAVQTCETELEKAQVHCDGLQAFALEEQEKGQDASTELSEAIADAWEKLTSLRLQVVVARETAIKADKLLSQETVPVHKSQRVSLSEGTLEWHSRWSGVAEGENVQRILAGVIKRRRPGQRKGKTAPPDVDDPDIAFEESDERHASRYCPWLRRRRCHHVMFQTPLNWRDHFESIEMERDRAVMSLKPTPSASASDELLHFVGNRLFRQGRHEILLRIVRQNGVNGKVPELKGFRFGVCRYGDEEMTQTDEDQRSIEKDQSHTATLRDHVLEASPRSVAFKDTKETISGGGLLRMKRRTSTCKSRHAEEEPSARAAENADTRAQRAEMEERARARSMLAPPQLGKLTLVDEDQVNNMMRNQEGANKSKAVAVSDLMILVVVEFNRLRFAVEEVACKSETSRESPGFLVEHKCLERWSDERVLDEDLNTRPMQLAVGKEPATYAFVMEINPSDLYGSAGKDGSVFIEVLPQEALCRSWWVDLMDRSADGQPRPRHAPPSWGEPAKRGWPLDRLGTI